MNLVRLFSILLLLPVALGACSDSDDSSGNNDPAPGIDAGGDGDGDGDTTTPVPGTAEYSLEVCPEAVPPDMLEMFDSLPDCSDVCGGARCVPDELAGDVPDALPKCDATSTCIPLEIATSGGDFKFAPCASLLDPMMQGACVPTCFAGSNAALLEQGTCTVDERCAPCVSPLDNLPTGACDLLECGGATTGDDAGTDDAG
jgi:hypothetical protein